MDTNIQITAQPPPPAMQATELLLFDIWHSHKQVGVMGINIDPKNQ
jgi:hypothetical protein